MVDCSSLQRLCVDHLPSHAQRSMTRPTLLGQQKGHRQTRNPCGRHREGILAGIDLVGVVEVGKDDDDLLHDGEHCIGRVTGSCTIGNHILRHRSQRSITMTWSGRL
eukprot:XP_001703868.1 Hypothetical protein GL50803_115613 [Giardia lamblia ATCC 50803]